MGRSLLLQSLEGMAPRSALHRLAQPSSVDERRGELGGQHPQRVHAPTLRTSLSSHHRLLMSGVVNSVNSIHSVCMWPSPVNSAVVTASRDPTWCSAISNPPICVVQQPVQRAPSQARASSAPSAQRCVCPMQHGACSRGSWGCAWSQSWKGCGQVGVSTQHDGDNGQWSMVWWCAHGAQQRASGGRTHSRDTSSR